MASRSPRTTEIRIGGSRRAPPVLPVLLALSVGANLFFFLRWAPKTEDPAPEPTQPEVADGPAPAPVPTGATEPTPAATPAPAAEATPGVASDPDGTRYVQVVIEGPVSGAFVDRLGSPEGDRVALTASRLLSWSFKPSSDARKGDTAEVLYRIDAGDPGEVTVLALRYRSEKLQKVVEGVRYHPAGWVFPSWFDEQGEEVPLRLKQGPIEEYEQITSLIGDGRGHSGMDFKAPVESPVLAPWDGTVERTNWNWKNNGNCIELQTAKGKVRFLHLLELGEGIRPGSRVKAGQVIARSGNTGRSFAPHLHYEIIDGAGRVVDPLKVHATSRRQLEGPELTKYLAERDQVLARLALLASASPAPPAAPTPSP